MLALRNTKLHVMVASGTLMKKERLRPDAVIQSDVSRRFHTTDWFMSDNIFMDLPPQAVVQFVQEQRTGTTPADDSPNLRSDGEPGTAVTSRSLMVDCRATSHKSRHFDESFQAGLHGAG